MALGVLIAMLAGAASADMPTDMPVDMPEPEPSQAAGGAERPGSPTAKGSVRSDPADFSSLAPNTAMDMVMRLPGFSFDTGAQVRGFAGAAGNVLIDGDR